MKKKTKKGLTKETLKYLESCDIKQQKSLGQYFTPEPIRKKLLSLIPKIYRPRILEPACGTGEFLLSCKRYFDSPDLVGIEIDPITSKIAKKLVPSANIICDDALKRKVEPVYDLVIGNPPFYEFTPSQELKKIYSDIIYGRTNIFAFFVKLGLDYLKDGGYLAYIIPPSMNNGAYFIKLRDYIIKNADIYSLNILDNSLLFQNAMQTVMLLVLKKGKNTGRYIFKKNGITLFTENPVYIKKAFKNTFSISDLGFSVKTGSIVWNQHKNELTDYPNGSIPLIWTHNIQNNTLFVKQGYKKKQYIHFNRYNIGPAIVVNRIIGIGKYATLKAALIPAGYKFLAENHINVIKKDHKAKKKFIPNITLEELHSQLISKEKVKIIQSISGNTQLSSKELLHLFPVSVKKIKSIK